MRRIIGFLTPLVAAAIVTTSCFAAEPNWNQVAEALGKSGTVQAGGVYRVGFPRTDLRVSLDGVALKPGFALGGWVAFQPMGAQTMIIGDLVLTIAPPPGTSQPADIDMIGIDRIMRYRGQDSGGIPRAQPITDQGTVLPGAMGSAIAINFQPTGFDTAAITGDFVLLASEVNPVIKALQANGIEITALHSHMLDEQPRVFFMHFWANDDARKLATGLRAALDKVDVKKEAAGAR